MSSTSLQFARDTATIVLPVILCGVGFGLIPGPTPPFAVDLVLFLSVVGGGVIAGWRFRKQHGAPSVFSGARTKKSPSGRFVLHSLALAVSISVVFLVISYILDPSPYRALANSPSIWLFWMMVPIQVGLNWSKVFASMLLGQWLQGRQGIGPS